MCCRMDPNGFFQMFQEQGAAPHSTNPIEQAIYTAVQWLKLGVESVGAVIIGLGVAYAFFRSVKALASNQPDGFNRIRLDLARYLALALEFQLGADILSTAISPTWAQIGKLGAIAIIRTGLNYFLMREMEQEKNNASTTKVTDVQTESKP
jgi:uncharacterized membrane protein